MEMKMFARPDRFGIRFAFMITGVIMMGLGLSLLIKISLGTDPCSCFTLGLVNYLPLSFGTVQLLCHLVTFAFVIRYDRSMIGYGTIGNMVFLGYISDFFAYIWKTALPDTFFESTVVRYGLLLPALAIFITGAAAYMTAGLGTSPYDALPFIMARSQKKLSFRSIRILWDLSFLAAGFLLGGEAGIVSILCAFFLGPTVTLFQKKFQILLKTES